MHIPKLAVAFVVAGACLGAASVVAQQPAFKRTVLQQVPISAAGREAVTARAEIPVGAATGRHTHPGEEIGYVIEGTVSVEIEGATKTMKAGDAFVIPNGKPHNAINIGKSQATVLATYIVETGKPVATPVP